MSSAFSSDTWSAVRPESWSAMRPESVASDFLLRFWDGVLPVDPIKIARAAGVKVYGRGGKGDKWVNYSGYFRWVDGHPTIEFNETEPAVRQRFTISHELGHFALDHHDAPRDSGDFPSSGDPKERAANRFAAELLMPSQAVQEIFLSGAFSSSDALAMRFGVSKAAIGYRLQNLGLI
jgi:Zn-dependent peptidase ImmA (M78 family)